MPQRQQVPSQPQMSAHLVGCLHHQLQLCAGLVLLQVQGGECQDLRVCLSEQAAPALACLRRFFFSLPLLVFLACGGAAIGAQSAGARCCEHSLTIESAASSGPTAATSRPSRCRVLSSTAANSGNKPAVHALYSERRRTVQISQ